MNDSERYSTYGSAAHTKICDFHQTKLAVVYVRQSTPQQVNENRESLARQYALKDHAIGLGWSADRILLIDEDLGLSGRTSDGRLGFQRLLAEVSMDHVGLVLGLEMSRLARSCKDWHHLLEVCALFGTLLADQDGVYDPSDPNDRLLLGLKGQISELELHTIRSRLDRGRLNKARRGELFLHAPIGYVKGPAGGLTFDPDEQAQQVVRMIFDKFDELGTLNAVHRFLRHNFIKIGVRALKGPTQGELDWRHSNVSTVARILHHPIYSGTYVFGRSPGCQKKRRPGKTLPSITNVPMEEWGITLHDKIPAYITWERYLRNLARMRENRCTARTRGAPRKGSALLGGLVLCGRCGCRMNPLYGTALVPRYECVRHLRNSEASTCVGISAAAVDQLVAEQILAIVSPLGIDLSLRAADNVEMERARLTKNWQAQVERANYEAGLEERRFRLVDPENRLVARTLEKQWEIALRKAQQAQEGFERFQLHCPARLTDNELKRIHLLSGDIPALWQSAETTAVERKQIIRILVNRVAVTIQGRTEISTVRINWVGGAETSHYLRRPVASYEQLSEFPQLRDAIINANRAGKSAAEIAEILNAAGFQPLSLHHKQFTPQLTASLVYRLGLGKPRVPKIQLGQHEWWQRDLARILEIPLSRLRYWGQKGFVNVRRLGRKGNLIIWADENEMQRLQRLRNHPRPNRLQPLPKELTRPNVPGSREK